MIHSCKACGEASECPFGETCSEVYNYLCCYYCNPESWTNACKYVMDILEAATPRTSLHGKFEALLKLKATFPMRLCDCGRNALEGRRCVCGRTEKELDFFCPCGKTLKTKERLTHCYECEGKTERELRGRAAVPQTGGICLCNRCRR